MRIVIVCPVPAGSRLGNRITAVRWRSLLAGLGHHVTITTGIPRARYDVLVALHAFRTADVVRWSRDAHPERPIVVALTGTDLSRDIHVSEEARRSLRLADRLVVLHDQASRELPRGLRAKVRLIRQSAEPVRPRRRDGGHTFDVALVAHLRDEKDPLRAALATRLLPASSRLRVVHAGRALTDEWARRARAEQASNARYHWLGEVGPSRARQIIASARLMVLTSLSEGGANVLGEAIASGTPVITTRIPAAVSAMGSAYPGFFRVGDTAGLTRLLARAEHDPRYLALLARDTKARRRLFAPSTEAKAWRSLLAELPRP
ncbi:MAG TPA: selenoneine biosynthesis selenosugar synthase SenB [Polyangiaceae bacterium]